MSRLFRLLAVLAIIIVSLGFYRGWFTLTGERDAEDHHLEVKLSVDTDKVEHDAEAVNPSQNREDVHNEQ